MRIKDLDAADAELSFRSWGLALAGRSTRRKFAFGFLEAVGDDGKFDPALWTQERVGVSPLIWFLLAELALKILLEWLKTRTPNA